MKYTVIDPVNRVLTPVIGFLTGMTTTITITAMMHQQYSVASTAGLASIMLAVLTYFACKFTIREVCE